MKRITFELTGRGNQLGQRQVLRLKSTLFRAPVQWYDESRAFKLGVKRRCLQQDNHPAFSNTCFKEETSAWTKFTSDSISGRVYFNK